MFTNKGTKYKKNTTGGRSRKAEKSSVTAVQKQKYCLLWSPYVIGQTIIFSSCFFLSFFLSSFFSSPNVSGRRLDVYHTLAHGVALVRI